MEIEKKSSSGQRMRPNGDVIAEANGTVARAGLCVGRERPQVGVPRGDVVSWRRVKKWLHLQVLLHLAGSIWVAQRNKAPRSVSEDEWRLGGRQSPSLGPLR